MVCAARIGIVFDVVKDFWLLRWPPLHDGSEPGEEVAAGGGVHMGEGEEFFAEVFEGGADVVDVLVDNQETVVGLGGGVQGHAGILDVVPLDVLPELPRNPPQTHTHQKSARQRISLPWAPCIRLVGQEPHQLFHPSLIVSSQGGQGAGK